MTKRKVPRYSNREIDKKLETNGYCCWQCGYEYLTKEQKKEHQFSTFHLGECVLCSEEKPVTHIRNYNWLIKPKTK